MLKKSYVKCTSVLKNVENINKVLEIMRKN